MKSTKAAKPETAELRRTKILLFDTENSPNESWTWGTYQQNVIKVKTHRQVFCFSWQWLNERKVHSLALPDFPEYKKNPRSNKSLMTALHGLIGSADIVIGHNVDGFDKKRVNTDFIKNGLKPIHSQKTIDTLKIARRIFGFNSNRLGDLGEFLGLGKKVRHSGFELWERCLNGDMAAWKLMKRYCAGDTRLLKKIYLKLRPWMPTHPDVNALTNRSACPACASKRITMQKWRITAAGRRPQFQCQECGKWAMGKFSNGKWRFN